MRGRQTAVLWAISVLTLCGTGCADLAKRKPAICVAKPAYARPARRVDSEASVYLSSMVFQPSGGRHSIVLDLKSAAEPDGKLLAPFVPLLSNADLALRVRQPKSATEMRAYNALLGHDLTHDVYTAGQVETSAATVTVYAGWTLAAGQYPAGQTGWVSGTANGTVFIVRIEPATERDGERHSIYNLKAGKPGIVNVTLLATSETRPLRPGEVIVVSERAGLLPAPRQIEPADLFVEEVLRRAAEAGIDLSGIPARK